MHCHAVFQRASILRSTRQMLKLDGGGGDGMDRADPSRHTAEA